MRYLDNKYVRASALLVAAAGAAIAASAAWGRETALPPTAPMVEVGTLTCSLGAESRASDANPAAQGRDVLCQFRPGENGPEETYVGTLQGVGKADALFAKGAVMLSVKGPDKRAVPGMLQQSYASDAAPKGAAAPLVGERDKDIVLQPLHNKEGRVERNELQPEAMIIRLELRLKSSSA